VPLLTVEEEIQLAKRIEQGRQAKRDLPKAELPNPGHRGNGK
jgi:hypothetical protein